MCNAKELCTLLLLGLVSAAPRTPIDFQRTLQYSKLNETEQHQLESFLRIAADNLNESDGETFVHVTNALAPNLGTIFMLFKQLNATKEFRSFVHLIASEKGFESKLETALVKTNFADVEVLQHASAELQTSLTPTLKNHYIEFSSLQVTKDLMGNVTQELNDLNEHDRVVAVGALRIILKTNVPVYVPPPKPSMTSTTKSSQAKGSASLIHKCSGGLLAFTISSLFLF